MASRPLVILTGHRGYLGAALAEQLEADQTWRIHRVRSSLLDLESLTAELSIFRNESVLIVHLATINRTKCTDSESCRANGEMITHLARATQDTASRALLFASAADVFGAPRELPLQSASDFNPLDWYAKSKVESEQLLQETGLAHGVFRFPGIFGARENEQSLLGRLLHKGLHGEEIVLTNSGENRRDFVTLADAVALLKAWLARPRFGRWNIASGTSYTMHQLVRALQNAAGQSFKVTRSPVQTERDFDLVFDTRDLRTDFPEVVVRDALSAIPDYVALKQMPFRENSPAVSLNSGLGSAGGPR